MALLEKQMLELDISNELKRRELTHFCSTIEDERETRTKIEAGMKFTKFLTKNLRIFQLPTRDGTSYASNLQIFVIS